MASQASVGNALRAVYMVLFLLMAGGMTELLLVQGYGTCFNMLARWAIQILADFSIYILVLGSWVAYKESSWFKGVPFMVSLFFLGSLPSMGYIVLQFYKLSPEEMDKDPIYFVLAKRYKRDDVKGLPVVAARVVFFLLTCYMVGILIYTIYVDIYIGPDINKCLLSNILDVYVHYIALSVWVGYKESSFTSAFYWVLFILCFRGLAICVYILRQLFYLSPGQPVSLILFNKSNRDLHTTDPLLMVHPNE